MKRFWSTVTVTRTDDGHEVRLDGRPMRTPMGAPCRVPTRALAEAMAEEWRAVSEGAEVRPLAMPLTRAANTAIDRVLPDAAPVVDAIAAYGESDLLCYRAPYPEGLARRQAAAWDPLLAWAAEALGAPLVAVAGVMHTAQPPASLARLRAAVAAHDAWELVALHDLVTLSGSLVLGLAVSHGRIAPAAAWEASRIDEQWNIEEWGEDAEAAAVAERRREEFLAAARLMALLRAEAK